MQREVHLFNYFDTLVRYLRAQPLNLGGYAAPSGGIGGGGGYIGFLPQTRVAYDETEAATDFTPTTSASLVDNLNHIRYRILNLENTAIENTASGVIIKEDGTIIASGVTIIDFINNFTVSGIAPNEVIISLINTDEGGTVVLSGVHGEDLSNQIGTSQTHFTTANEFYPGFLRVYYNGLRQNYNDIIEDSDSKGFTTVFTVYSGDSIVVDYDVLVSGVGAGLGHAHSQYVTYTYLNNNYLTEDETTALLVNKSDIGHNHVEADITDLDHDATSIIGITVDPSTPYTGDVLMYDSGQWIHTTVSGLGPNLIKQQALFYAAGDELRPAETGIKPMRIYIHDVGFNCNITEVFISAGTAPTSTPLRIDILKNEISILNSPNYIELPVGQYTVSETSFFDDVLSKDDYLKWKLVQGDISASDLTIHVRFKWEA